MTRALNGLIEGMPIVFGGDRQTSVSADLAARFKAGDQLVVVQETGDLLHVPKEVHALARAAVSQATHAFAAMGAVTDAAIGEFFERFAALLESEVAWALIDAANRKDMVRAIAAGRSTTRLIVTDAMRAEMIAGLRAWRDAPAGRGAVVERVEHAGWSVEQVTAPLGVVGFVFEGRPNVFADAVGVIRGGNTVVFRIGSDALETARAIASNALSPALAAAGLPAGAAVLLESTERAGGWALFADPRLALAVARGSGPAVAQLGAVARQAGTPVSLHGTGGSWLIADDSADAQRFAQAVIHSLDRKVCNTLGVCCIAQSRAAELVPVFLDALARAAAARGQRAKLHMAEGGEAWISPGWQGDIESLVISELGREWEWEDSPEVSLKIVANLDEAVELFNRFSPRFIACVIADDPTVNDRFYGLVDAAFVGDGFTRWVDGQYALNRPELGLSNWQHGRLFARGGVLSGNGVFTLRMRMRQSDMSLSR